MFTLNILGIVYTDHPDFCIIVLRIFKCSQLCVIFWSVALWPTPPTWCLRCAAHYYANDAFFSSLKFVFTCFRSMFVRSYCASSKAVGVLILVF